MQRRDASHPSREVDDSPPALDQAIETLFNTESAGLFRYACTLPGVDPARAEDLVQTTFVDAITGWAKLSQLVPEAKRAWLRRVLRNKEIDRWRQERPLRLVDEVEDDGQPSLMECAHQVLCTLALDRVWEVISKMPRQRQRAAFLCWNLDWSTRETADWLGVTQGTVRSHLKLARDELIDAAKAAVPFIDEHVASEDDGRGAGT